ncbi:hypothetical protein WME98_07330 [Sorangium sp. So ce296]|uniref:hypothetical protein n=1 Tax=Sorangium sp. So ce296 TaxID=3133296 RepID=UPI003F5D5883
MMTPAWSWARALLLSAVVLAAAPGCPSNVRPEDEPRASGGGAGANDGGGGAGGDGGGGGGAGACVDDDPCTAERLDASGQCIYPAAPDGTPCGRGDVCSAGDRCVGGACTEVPVSVPAEIYGTGWGYGAAPAEGPSFPLEGMAEFLSNDRILFGERLGGNGLSLSLVRVDEGGLQRLGQRTLDIGVEHYFGSWDWSDGLLTSLVPLGPDRVVVVGTRQRLELLGLEGDRITTLSQRALDPRSDSIVGGAGRGDRFWTCAGSWVSAWRVGADDALVEETAHAFQLLAGTCRSLALSADGAVLWIATSHGLVPVDVSSPAGPVIKPARFASQAFFHAQLNDTYLVAQELLRYGELGSIHVFRVADLDGAEEPAPVKSFSPDEGADLWDRPLGFALLDDDLLVEWFRVNGATRSYVVDRHALSPAGVSSALGSLLVRESDEAGLLPSPLRLAARGRHAVLHPWRRVVALDGSAAMRFRTGLHHGSLERIWAGEDGAVLAVGPFGVHSVDLGDPMAPVLTAGGTVFPPDMQRLRLAPAPSEAGALDLVTLPSSEANVHQEGGTAVLSCLGPGEGGLLAPSGQLRIEGGPAVLASAPGQLFQAAPIDGGALRLRRFALPARCAGELLGPASEQIIAPQVSSAPRVAQALAVDGERAEVLLGQLYYEDLVAEISLLWFSWTGAGPMATGTLSGTGDLTAVALAGDRALVIENRQHVYVLRRDGEDIVVHNHVDLSQAPSPMQASRILSFDGTVAWLAIVSPSAGALALLADDGTELARYPTPSPVRSLALAGERLVLGMNEAITIAAPVCGASRSARRAAGPSPNFLQNCDSGCSP